jgi:hypothetical protein
VFAGTGVDWLRRDIVENLEWVFEVERSRLSVELRDGSRRGGSSERYIALSRESASVC